MKKKVKNIWFQPLKSLECDCGLSAKSLQRSNDSSWSEFQVVSYGAYSNGEWCRKCHFCTKCYEKVLSSFEKGKVCFKARKKYELPQWLVEKLIETFGALETTIV